jgi:serine/threonine-protein kinase
MSKEFEYNKLRQWKIGEKIKILDTYEFERTDFKESEGGFGNVFVVVEPYYKRNLFLMVKVARDEDVSLAIKQKDLDSSIKKEAKILLTLPPHPNIVESCIVQKIYGKYHIFMELVEDGNLAQLIYDDNRSFQKKGWPELYSIIYQIATGIKFLHYHGIIHKDLKPNNILIKKIKKDNTSNLIIPKITDFGISGITKPYQKRSDERLFNNFREGSLTEEYSNNAHTPAYAPPEQEGLIANAIVDNRSDIFSFGIVILELITSQLGFKDKINYYSDVFNTFYETVDEKMMSTLDNILQTRIDYFINKRKKYTPIPIKDIIKKCLRLDPKDRYHDFDEIVREIQKLIYFIKNPKIINSVLKIEEDIRGHGP